MFVTVHMAQAKIRAEGVADVQAVTERLFAAINTAQPEGMRYASCLLADGETFIALLELDEGIENPVTDYREFRELQEHVERSRLEPATVQELSVVATYRLFSNQAVRR